jgi:hypothetical protein
MIDWNDPVVISARILIQPLNFSMTKKEFFLMKFDNNLTSHNDSQLKLLNNYNALKDAAVSARVDTIHHLACA